MRYREFGNTGMKVSEIGFGCWAIGGNSCGNSYGKTEDKTSLEAIHRAVALGCNFFDTADVYGHGHSEELLGRALRGKRDRIIIATKGGADFYRGRGYQDFSQGYIRSALEKSLERLQTDYVDVYQLHNPPLKLIQQPHTYSVLKDLKREGKIRAWGVSIFDPLEGIAAITAAQPDCLQVVFNIFAGRAANILFPEAQKASCAIIAREPLANGFLTGKYHSHNCQFEPGDIRHSWPPQYIQSRIQAVETLERNLKISPSLVTTLALKYVLAEQAVSVTIPGIKDPEQADCNLGLDTVSPLSSEDLARIYQLQSTNFGLHQP